MTTAIGSRRLQMSEGWTEFKRWRLVLACFVLIALAAFAQQPPTKASIRPTGPLPAVNVP